MVSPNQPIEEYKDVNKSVFESFDKLCQSKNIYDYYDINIYIMKWFDGLNRRI